MKKGLICFFFLLALSGECFANPMHVLKCNEESFCVVILHIDMPGGSNSAGITWRAALVDDGIASTPTTLSNSIINSDTEKASIASGDIVEWKTATDLSSVPLSPAAERKASFDEISDRLISEQSAIWQRKYRLYGYQQSPQ